MRKNIIKLLAIISVMFMLVSCVELNYENKVGSNNLKNTETKISELTKKEKEYNEYVNEKSIVYSTLSLEDKKDYYNKIFYLYKSPNYAVRTEMYSRTWANLRYITDEDSDIINFLMEKVLSDEGIFYKIGSKDTDDVLLRSYSLKVITSLINRSNLVETIDKNDLVNIKEKLIEYIYLEKDRRGYIEYIGDANSFTNWLEAISAIINVLELSEKDKEELINVMKDQLTSPYTSFNASEDVRLAVALSKLVVNGKDTKYLEDFINGVDKDLKDINKNDKENYVYVKSNVSIFLKTFYYRTDIMVGVNKESIKEIINDYMISIDYNIY